MRGRSAGGSSDDAGTVVGPGCVHRYAVGRVAQAETADESRLHRSWPYDDVGVAGEAREHARLPILGIRSQVLVRQELDSWFQFS